MWNSSKSLRLLLKICVGIAVNRVIMAVEVEQDRSPRSCEKCSLYMPSDRLYCCFG
jgi:hypothetical protein